MQMVSAVPAIHFKPVERKKTNKSESVHRFFFSSAVMSDVTCLIQHAQACTRVPATTTPCVRVGRAEQLLW